jgi:isochorismate synthase
VATFLALCQKYDHAFISLVSIPGVGTWIGATPETLLALTPTSLKTVALAGTRASPTDRTLEDVIWGTKEIEEQALVSDYIRHFLQQLPLANFSEVGPRTVSAGNIIHLKTDFSIADTAATQLGQHGLSELANRILDSLHPTSAVCGMPKKEALSFILERERYNRAFYSGFLGPIHIEAQSRLFVNLRCMQLTPERAILYVGAGITADSVPALEWQETVLKSKTLLSVLETEAMFEPIS